MTRTRRRRPAHPDDARLRDAHRLLFQSGRGPHPWRCAVCDVPGIITVTGLQAKLRRRSWARPGDRPAQILDLDHQRYSRAFLRGRASKWDCPPSDLLPMCRTHHDAKSVLHKRKRNRMTPALATAYVQASGPLRRARLSAAAAVRCRSRRAGHLLAVMALRTAAVAAAAVLVVYVLVPWLVARAG